MICCFGESVEVTDETVEIIIVCIGFETESMFGGHCEGMDQVYGGAGGCQ